MKGYKIFIGLGAVLLVLYIVAQFNRPQPISWDVTLNKDDKNPYGSFIVYNQLKRIFPSARVTSYREPWYNMLLDSELENTAYINIAKDIHTADLDVAEACKYVEAGNYMFVSAYNLTDELLDTLGLELSTTQDLLPKDSISLNFVSPHVKSKADYTFLKFTINEYFSKTSKPDSTIILSSNNHKSPVFVRVNCGKGAFFVHAAPLCFSNYFMLHQNNSEYTSKVLSFIPPEVDEIIWDEYYKLGREGASTPLRFFLSNTFLKWALWLSIIGLLVYVIIERKRKQRIIPEIPPLRNTTLDFVNTVASVYFEQKDNKGIAEKKLQFWSDFVRQRFYLSTQHFDDEFVLTLSKKSGVEVKQIRKILSYISHIKTETSLSDAYLKQINQSVDSFYQQAK